MWGACSGAEGTSNSNNSSSRSTWACVKCSRISVANWTTFGSSSAPALTSSATPEGRWGGGGGRAGPLQEAPEQRHAPPPQAHHHRPCAADRTADEGGGGGGNRKSQAGVCLEGVGGRSTPGEGVHTAPLARSPPFPKKGLDLRASPKSYRN